MTFADLQVGDSVFVDANTLVCHFSAHATFGPVDRHDRKQPTLASTRNQGRMLRMQPVQEVRSKLPRGFEQIVGVLFLDDPGMVIETQVPQLGTLREEYERCLVRLAEREFQGVDPERVMAWRALLHFKTAGVEGEFAEQQGGVVCVGEAAVVAQSGHTGVGEFAADDAKQVAYLGDGRLMVSQLTDLQPVL
jgi:hypothetical protein